MQALEADRRTAPRPVQARSHRTRAKILEATTQVLFEVGYAGAKTPLIAERAGVSQGALYRHFPTKIDLLSSALAETLTDARGRFEQAFAGDAAFFANQYAGAPLIEEPGGTDPDHTGANDYYVHGVGKFVGKLYRSGVVENHRLSSGAADC